MKRRWYLIGVVGLVAAGVLAALGATSASGRGSAKTLVIGAALDLSGQMSPFDGPALTAAQLEAKKINAKGGVNGMKIQINVCNHQLNPAKGTSCAQNLIAQGAKIMLVTCDVDYATPAATVALNNGLLTWRRMRARRWPSSRSSTTGGERPSSPTISSSTSRT
jgi:branched-chain amino acid transport system substrate-binding protein